MKRLVVTVALATVCSASACAPKAPDYQSIWTTSSTASTTTATPTEKPVSLPQYLEGLHVAIHQVPPNKLPDLKVSIPTPKGWTPFTNPNISPDTVLISPGRKYPSARLVVATLKGDFDPGQVAKHGNADAQLFENFKQLDASDADFNGFPSSMIQGSFDLEGTRLHTWNRIVVPTGSGPDKQRYLVQLTITSLANEAAAQATDIDAIIRGFVVAAK